MPAIRCYLSTEIIPRIWRQPCSQSTFHLLPGVAQPLAHVQEVKKNYILIWGGCFQLVLQARTQKDFKRLVKW